MSSGKCWPRRFGQSHKVQDLVSMADGNHFNSVILMAFRVTALFQVCLRDTGHGSDIERPGHHAHVVPGGHQSVDVVPIWRKHGSYDAYSPWCHTSICTCFATSLTVNMWSSATISNFSCTVLCVISRGRSAILSFSGDILRHSMNNLCQCLTVLSAIIYFPNALSSIYIFSFGDICNLIQNEIACFCSIRSWLEIPGSAGDAMVTNNSK